ncbi:CLUMA_CG012259, isoform A [Clunio marinus]|uniref:CLUMA_CG012259, isoform A n=1 Tax=Clunio marinus TaxID=568069 RepID=A0A1J1IH08_9DIPT|nr:CLUMA_CG012259, isoform A [Clunio marinus]
MLPSSSSKSFSVNPSKREISDKEDNSPKPSKQFILSEGATEHFEYKIYRGSIVEEVVITCKICQDIKFSTESIDFFRAHVSYLHFNSSDNKWDKFCSLCDSVITHEYPFIANEFEHLVATHLNPYISL